MDRCTRTLPTSCPAAILSRLIVVLHSRYIKCIITQDSTLILDADQPLVQAFRKQLQQRLRDKLPSFTQFGNGSALPINTNVSFTKQRLDPPYELKALETALDNVSIDTWSTAPKYRPCLHLP